MPHTPHQQRIIEASQIVGIDPAQALAVAGTSQPETPSINGRDLRRILDAWKETHSIRAAALAGNVSMDTARQVP